MRHSNPELDELLGVQIPILDHGFIRLIDYMGDDAAVVQAARVSYGEGTKTVLEDAGLIEYLLEHRHTTPFEMGEIKLHVKLPIFVARQWIRHRTANVNEYSARYSEMHNEFYVPERSQVQAQSTSNKQGRDGQLSEEEIDEFIGALHIENQSSWDSYQRALGNGVAREMARMVLPLNVYTSWYWKIDLHNLMHFLALRCDEHAQWEIRQYASKILCIMILWVPHTARAFEKHVLGGTRLSRPALQVVRRMIDGQDINGLRQQFSRRQWNNLTELFEWEEDDEGTTDE